MDEGTCILLFDAPLTPFGIQRKPSILRIEGIRREIGNLRLGMGAIALLFPGWPRIKGWLAQHENQPSLNAQENGNGGIGGQEGQEGCLPLSLN